MNYYINKNVNSNPNNNNEVHKEGCQKMPDPNNRIYLGNFKDGIEAVAYAKRQGFYRADGCVKCCPEAHKE